uniref:Uncharacterized protein n=1 Tax=Panagrolaimus sp. PS1159 TaxID=55785 RepID=A0AC35G0Q4_9BILA
MLHPIFAVYPIGLANMFHPMVSFAIIGITILSSMAMLDCNTAMLMHSYYGIQRLRETTKKPLIVYMFLSGLTFAGGALGVLVVFVKPLFLLFFIPPEQVSQALKSNFNNISETIKTKNVLLLVQSSPNSIPLLITILGGCACLRITISFIYLCFNWNLYTNLEGEIPYDQYKRNLMFFRIAYVQFIGFGIFVGLPIFINTLLLLFVKKSSILPNIFMISLNFFSIFCVIVLFIAVRPYRLFVKRFIKKCAGINTQVNVYTTQ